MKNRQANSVGVAHISGLLSLKSKPSSKEKDYLAFSLLEAKHVSKQWKMEPQAILHFYNNVVNGKNKSIARNKMATAVKGGLKGLEKIKFDLTKLNSPKSGAKKRAKSRIKFSRKIAHIFELLCAKADSVNQICFNSVVLLNDFQVSISHWIAKKNAVGIQPSIEYTILPTYIYFRFNNCYAPGEQDGVSGMLFFSRHEGENKLHHLGWKHNNFPMHSKRLKRLSRIPLISLS